MAVDITRVRFSYENFFLIHSNYVFLGSRFHFFNCVFPNPSNFVLQDIRSFAFFSNFFPRILTNLKGHFVILHVKGIGFKVFYFRKIHALYFILGYNHLTRYILPSDVVVKVRKNYLLFFSTNPINLGRSIFQIRHLRFPDPYRGKGIRYRYQIIKFKVGKQRLSNKKNKNAYFYKSSYS